MYSFVTRRYFLTVALQKDHELSDKRLVGLEHYFFRLKTKQANKQTNKNNKNTDKLKRVICGKEGENVTILHFFFHCHNAHTSLIAFFIKQKTSFWRNAKYSLSKSPILKPFKTKVSCSRFVNRSTAIYLDMNFVEVKKKSGENVYFVQRDEMLCEMNFNKYLPSCFKMRDTLCSKCH